MQSRLLLCHWPLTAWIRTVLWLWRWPVTLSYKITCKRKLKRWNEACWSSSLPLSPLDRSRDQVTLPFFQGHQLLGFNGQGQSFYISVSRSPQAKILIPFMIKIFLWIPWVLPNCSHIRKSQGEWQRPSSQTTKSRVFDVCCPYACMHICLGETALLILRRVCIVAR